MKKILVLAIVMLASVFVLNASFGLAPHQALADTASTIKGGVCDAAGGTCPADSAGTLSNTFADIINVLSALVGVLAVIMIIVGGFRYVTSAGNPEGAKTARNTIVYAVVGLVVVALAQIIVHFVLNKTTEATTGTTPVKSNVKTIH